jgi:Na+/phosphate symporter
MMSPKLDSEFEKLGEFHNIPVSENLSTEEGLLVMMSKLIEMSKILSKCYVIMDDGLLSQCEKMAHEVHAQEGLITTSLVGASKTIGHNLFKIVVRLPGRMERIGDMFESILTCCRIKAKEGIPFSDKAHSELAAVFSIVESMLINVRDGLVIQNSALIQHILDQRKKLGQLLIEARFAHWDRLEAGFCAPVASSLYLDILDSFTAINEYLGKICDSLNAIDSAEKGESPV